MTEREKLFRVHELRLKAHWGKFAEPYIKIWPQTEKDWRQTPHGAPWDSHVELAEFTLKLARQLQKEGILDAG